MTHRQTALSGLAALVTLAACAASHFATTPNALAACAIVGTAGLAAFAVTMGAD